MLDIEYLEMERSGFFCRIVEGISFAGRVCSSSAMWSEVVIIIRFIMFSLISKC